MPPGVTAEVALSWIWISSPSRGVDVNGVAPDSVSTPSKPEVAVAVTVCVVLVSLRVIVIDTALLA